MDCLEKYFNLTENQKELFTKFKDVFLWYNQRINLISRKDAEHLCVRHILHSLSIAKFIDFKSAKIVDVGTGGGLPGIPLAIMFPEAEFFLIDSIGKKISAVNDIIDKLELKNVVAQQKRSPEIKQKFDYVVARAVTNFPKFYQNVKHLVRRGQAGNRKNGIIYLKGGDFSEEIQHYKSNIKIVEIDDFFWEDFFISKKIIHFIF